MNRVFLFIAFATVLLIACSQREQEISQWRGPNRDGIYNETGLLKEWPEEGPGRLWSYEGLGYGHSSVAVANQKVYVTGVKDTIFSTGVLFAFDLDGNLLWKKEYGKDFTLNFHGTRSTPAVVDDLIYIESGMGQLYCLSSENGDEVWSVDFIEDFGVDSVIQFGFSESVLIDGEHLYCVPGGAENNVVKLNRFTGNLIWASEGYKEQATYNSPILIEHNGLRLIIATTMSSVMGIDEATGEMYWRTEHTQQNKIHANTPVYSDGKVVIATPDPKETSGMVQLQLSDDGKNAEVVWRNKKLRSFMGGIIQIDTCIYGASHLRNNWEVLSWNTGETLVQNKDLGGGPVIYADGMFYGYAERDGEMALMKAGPEKIEVISRFKAPLGTGEHWAHPVIADKKLFIRHGEALMVYDIAAKA